MNTKHTPGPWRVDGTDIYTKVAGSDHWVAAIKQRRPNSEDEANAKLIAAAPDLLAALDGLLKATRKAAAVAETANDEYADTDAHFVGEWIDQAREAIAKATT